MTRTMSRNARQIVSNFLCRVPARRLGYGAHARENIRAEPFFKDVNWEKLEQRQLEPPFRPKVKDPRTASNFDSEFTSERACVTPLAKHELDLIDQVPLLLLLLLLLLKEGRGRVFCGAAHTHTHTHTHTH